MTSKQGTPEIQPTRDVPPPKRRWKDVVAELQQSPGEWHLVAQDALVSVSSYLRTRYGLEVRVSGTNRQTNRCSAVYARVAPGTDRTAELVAAVRVLLDEMRDSPRAEARDFAEETEAVEQKLYELDRATTTATKTKE